MLYTEKEKHEIERVKEVFAEHLRQSPDFELLWSDKVGYRAAKRGADGVSAAAVLRPNGGRDSYQATESGHPQRKKPLCLRRAAGQTAASGKPWKEKSGSVGSAPDS